MVGRIGTILKWLLLLPILAVVALLAVANDHLVLLNFNPFQPDDPALQLELPLYQVAFATFVLGALVGALITWMNQLRHRRRAVRQRDEARRDARRAEEARPAAHSGLLPGPGGTARL